MPFAPRKSRRGSALGLGSLLLGLLVFLVLASYFLFKLIVKNYFYEKNKAINQKEEIENQKYLIEEVMEKVENLAARFF